MENQEQTLKAKHKIAASAIQDLLRSMTDAGFSMPLTASLLRQLFEISDRTNSIDGYHKVTAKPFKYDDASTPPKYL